MSKPKILTEAVEKVMSGDVNIPHIKDKTRHDVTRQLIENHFSVNSSRGLYEASADQANVAGAGVANWDPVLVKMVRKGVPKSVAFDLTGVQPMSAPSQHVFCMRPRYTSQTGAEAFLTEPNSAFSGTGSQAGDTSGFPIDAFGTGDPAATTTKGTGLTTAAGQALGTVSGGSFGEMAFTIESSLVSAKTRKLKAEFSRELEEDMLRVHGLSARDELGKILSDEIIAEIDRELIRTINIAAKAGAQSTTTPGIFDLQGDSDGRWLVERFKGLIFQIQLEANKIGIDTRRGRGNVIVCSANVASALDMAGVLEYNPQMTTMLNVDVTGNTFAGMLLGRIKVMVDPYATVDYCTIGYKGASAYDAGVYYCPYIGMERADAVGEDSLQPKIAFRTRYGIIANPFASADASGVKSGAGLGQAENQYYRKFRVDNVAQ